MNTTLHHHPAFAPHLNAQAALLALADGSVFFGRAIGALGTQSGEVVFNTAMTGYQEILTDPSYARQLITLTYPHIGNVGANALDCESKKSVAAGLIIGECSPIASSWRTEEDLTAFLRAQNIIGIAGIDTRALTQLLRTGGAQNGCIVAGDNAQKTDANIQRAVQIARDFAGLEGMDLAIEVTTQAAYKPTSGAYDVTTNSYQQRDIGSFNVVAIDFGIKNNILRLLAEHDCQVEVMPATTTSQAILAKNPDGVFLSNGPGDPEPCTYAIEMIQEIMAAGVPIFGICLGHQLLALASGAKTIKMKFGHHGANHPVQDLKTGKVMITSQNHGFAVDEQSLPTCLRATHKSLFDGSLQGIERVDCPAFSFQGHPEASPGPRDVAGLFARFVSLMQAKRCL